MKLRGYEDGDCECENCNPNPKTQQELEKQVIKELARSVCQELTGSEDGNEEGQREFIEGLIKEWLSKVCVSPHKEEWKLIDWLFAPCNEHNASPGMGISYTEHRYECGQCMVKLNPECRTCGGSIESVVKEEWKDKPDETPIA
jgi:hypothetical protein